jgi:hypothetical protein
MRRARRLSKAGQQPCSDGMTVVRSAGARSRRGGSSDDEHGYIVRSAASDGSTQ